MDLSTAQHQLLHHRYPHPHPHQHQHQHQHQEMMGSHSDSQSLDSIIASSKPAAAATAHQAEPPQQQQDKKPRPPDNEAQKCPRCDSTNTKFCYYNNYSLTQPRYFCKSCRRYWTKGGTLRNVPVGGGCRKSSSSSSSIKRPSSSSSATSSPSHSFSSSMFKRAHNHDALMAAMGVDPSSNPLFSTLHHQMSSSYGGGGLGLGFEDCEGLLSANPHGASFLSSLRSGAFLDPHNNAAGGLFQSLCYGNESGINGGGNSNSVSGISEENVGVNMPYEEAASTGTLTAMKQELGVRGNESNRAMWGFPWQVNYGDLGGVPVAAAGGGDHVEPAIRGGWNGLIGNSAWGHGLLNTPAALM